MHWSDEYVGMSYTDKFDCADLANLIQKEQFNKSVSIPTRSDTSLKALSQMIDSNLDDYVSEVVEPVTGDLVLMKSGNRLNHLGVYFSINSISYVIHNSRSIGSVVVNRLSDLHKFRLKNIGYFRLR